MVTRAGDLEKLTGTHVELQAPSQYVSLYRDEIGGYDKVYEALSNLIGKNPYDGQMITILYDSTIESATAYAGNPVRIGRGFWGEPHLRLISHEFGHIFTLQKPFTDIIFPHRAFVEGWAQFSISYCAYSVFPAYFEDARVVEVDGYYTYTWHSDGMVTRIFRMPTHETFKKDVLDEALQQYMATGPDIGSLTDNAAAAMLQIIADRYGWQVYEQFFSLILEADSTGVRHGKSLDLLVHYLSSAAGEDLTDTFIGWGFSPSSQYNLTIASTAGGSVSTPSEGTSTYYDGMVVTLAATPDDGYRFVNWAGDVDTIANVGKAETTITMQRDYSIIANFAAQRELTVVSTSGGAVIEPGEGTFVYGEGAVVNLVAEPEEGYRFVNWSGDVETIADTNAASTTVNMGGDYSITASFEAGADDEPPVPTGCFIATAAYGTPMAEEVQILRKFRDGYLLTNPVGQSFVNLYYSVSPPIGEFITQHPGLKPMVRAGLVPAVTVSTVVVNTTPTGKAGIAGLLVLVSVTLAVWAARRRGQAVQYA